MTKTFLYTIAALVLMTSWVHAQRETKFFTGFEYGSFDEEPFPFEPADLNGAEDQIGEWTGIEFPLGAGGDILPGAPDDAVGFKNNPYDNSRLLVVDRPSGHPFGDDDLGIGQGADFKGSLDATLEDPVLLLGAEISFQLGTRRTGGNQNKDYFIVGRDSNGLESFRMVVGTNNGADNSRLGYVADGETVFDLPTVVGEDGFDDMNNTGYNANIAGPYPDDTGGPGVQAEFANIRLALTQDGWIIDFAHDERNTSNESNAYTTDILPYNGAATDLAVVEFGYSGSGANGRNSGWFLDNVLVSGFEEIVLGDFNTDGKLDFADFTILSQNFGLQTSAGDIDFNGVVDLVDFAKFKAAFNAQAAGAQAASVPEPSTALLAMLVIVASLSFRKKR